MTGYAKGWQVPILLLLLCLATCHGARAQHLPAGAVFRDCPTCPEMVVVPPGTFMMGSTEADSAREMAAEAPNEFGFLWLFGMDTRQLAARTMAHEHPQHRVVIETQFALGRFPITVGQFAEFVAETHRSAGRCFLWGLHRPRIPIVNDAWRSPGFSQTAENPVVCISWRDAKAYVAWLNKKIPSPDGAGDLYRLPSEAEWEYAARAGTATTRWWGNDIGDGLSWCDGCGDPYWPTLNLKVAPYTGQPANMRRLLPGTIPVRWFPPNPFGLLGMPGNVWEFVEDCWHGSYMGAPTTGALWISGTCEERVSRGGDWEEGTWAVRSATRQGVSPDDAYNTEGFRVARRIVAEGLPSEH